MYKYTDNTQSNFLDFNQPIGLHMNPENRWVKIRDLFDLTKTNLQILEGKNKQIKINNLTNIQISNKDEFNDLYQSACKNITTCVT